LACFVIEFVRWRGQHGLARAEEAHLSRFSPCLFQHHLPSDGFGLRAGTERQGGSSAGRHSRASPFHSHAPHPGQSRDGPWIYNSRRVLGSFGFEPVHGRFENLCIFVDLRLVLDAEFIVDLVPVLGVLGFMRFLLPSGNVPFDKFSPYFCVSTTQLRRCCLEFSLPTR